ncbi:MAG: JAB domain-containing protein [Bacteroidia bacterium]
MKVTVPKGAKTKITESGDIYKIMHAILMRQTKLRRKAEYFWTIGLNVSNDIMYIELIAIGALNKVGVDPVELYSLAVGKKCKKIILVHNHTGTAVKPSTADIRLTKRLEHGGEILNIEIVDHLIISEKHGYYSFADERLL